MIKIREWKFREVLVEKGRKNGMKMMMNSEVFIGLFGQNRGTPYNKVRRDFDQTGSMLCFLRPKILFS